MAGIQRLLDIMARLRDPEGGCPWDLEQDFASISPFTIEEAYEVEIGKAAIVRDLLSDRATAATREVLESTVGRLHGQRLDAAIDTLCELAARQRERVVAEVRVAAPLSEEQSRRLAAALSSLKGRTVRLNVAVDPAVLGGVMVTIGDEVIDGTVASRLEQARRAVLG